MWIGILTSQKLMVVIQTGHYHILCQKLRNHWFMLWFSGRIGSTQTSTMPKSVAVSITGIHPISSKNHPVLLLTQSLSAALCKVSRPGFIFKWLSSVLKYSSWPLGSEISGSQHKRYSDTHLVKTQIISHDGKVPVHCSKFQMIQGQEPSPLCPFQRLLSITFDA